MFTIEHDFDATVITLIDDEAAPAQEDVTIMIFDDTVTVEQLDARTGTVQRVALSMNQMADLRAALDLPEGAYTRRPGGARSGSILS